MKKRLGIISLLIGIIFPIVSVLVPAAFIGPGSEPPVGLPFIFFGCIVATVIGFVMGIYAAIQVKETRVFGIFGALINFLYLSGYASFQIMKTLSSGYM